MTCVAFIPALHDSDLLLHPLAGKPALAYVIECARLASSVDHVIVLTADQRVQGVTRALGVETRLPSLQPLTVSEADEAGVLTFLRRSYGIENATDLETLVEISPLAPLLLPEDIDNALNILRSTPCRTVKSMLPLSYPVHRAQEDGSVKMTLPAVSHSDPAHIPAFWVDPSILTVRALDARGREATVGTALSPLPRARGLLLQEPIDWSLAEAFLRIRQEQKRWQTLPDPIDALVLDFDGVFTDNRVMVFQDGREAVLCSRGDGYGLGLLKKIGLPILVLSKESNPVVGARCAKLKIECHQGIDNKLPLLKQWLAERELDIQKTVYIGNDVNDLECLLAVGCGIVPHDAHPDVLPIAQFVLASSGGNGAIRELCDAILKRNSSAMPSSSRGD